MNCPNPTCKGGNQALTPGNYWKCSVCDGTGKAPEFNVDGQRLPLEKAMARAEAIHAKTGAIVAIEAAPLFVLFNMRLTRDVIPCVAPCTTEAGAAAVLAWLKYNCRRGEWFSGISAANARIAVKCPSDPAMMDHPGLEAFALRVGYKYTVKRFYSKKKGQPRETLPSFSVTVDGTFRKDLDPESAAKWPLLPDQALALANPMTALQAA